MPAPSVVTGPIIARAAALPRAWLVTEGTLAPGTRSKVGLLGSQLCPTAGSSRDAVTNPPGLSPARSAAGGNSLIHDLVNQHHLPPQNNSGGRSASSAANRCRSRAPEATALCGGHSRPGGVSPASPLPLSHPTGSTPRRVCTERQTRHRGAGLRFRPGRWTGTAGEGRRSVGVESPVAAAGSLTSLLAVTIAGHSPLLLKL